MNAIQQHIDIMFKDLPETNEIKRIKNDIYLNAMDRYDELRAQGKSDSEALGTIIIEIGERDVLLEEFGYDKDQDLHQYSVSTLEDVRNYLAVYKNESTKIASGVLLILLGAGATPTLDTFNLARIGVILLILSVAIAVGLFIMSGFRLDELENRMADEDVLFYLADDDYWTVESSYRDFQERERYRVPVGVMLCILAVIPIIMLQFFGNEILVQRYGVFLMLFMVGLGIFNFIKYGMGTSAYQKVLNIGEYSVEEKQFQKRIEPIAGIYWLIVTLIYFVWSFVMMAWHVSWIIWPIAGVLWSIVSLLIKYFFDERRF